MLANHSCGGVVPDNSSCTLSVSFRNHFRNLSSFFPPHLIFDNVVLALQRTWGRARSRRAAPGTLVCTAAQAALLFIESLRNEHSCHQDCLLAVVHWRESSRLAAELLQEYEAFTAGCYNFKTASSKLSATTLLCSFPAAKSPASL